MRGEEGYRGDQRSIRLFGKDKVLVLMKSRLKNLEAEKNQCRSTGPWHIDHVATLTIHALFSYASERAQMSHL